MLQSRHHHAQRLTLEALTPPSPLLGWLVACLLARLLAWLVGWLVGWFDSWLKGRQGPLPPSGLQHERQHRYHNIPRA